MMAYLAMVLEIGSALAEKVGQGEVGGRVQTAWLCLRLPMKSPWLYGAGWDGRGLTCGWLVKVIDYRIRHLQFHWQNLPGGLMIGSC